MLPTLPRHPTVYEVNARVWLNALAGRPHGVVPTLDTVPDAALDALAARGFDWLWLLGVWPTSPMARAAARANPYLRRELSEVLPDLQPADNVGSCFALGGYHVSAALGGDAALARFRIRLAARGLRLMLDFVPNHVGLGHRWLRAHPAWFVHGTAADLAAAPDRWCRVDMPSGPAIVAHGRDPHFPGWSDTLQLNYAHPGLRAAMTHELLRVAERCDGLRCDMAMLVLPEVFAHTWGIAAEPFWPAAIAALRQRHPNVELLAEAYWGLEATLLHQGFDHAYGKRLYDQLRFGDAAAVRHQLTYDHALAPQLARFVENHDETRATLAFRPGRHEAAAVLTYLAPGIRLFHQGQLEGFRIRVPMQLCRGPVEEPDAELAGFYDRILGVLADPAFRNGTCVRLPCLATPVPGGQAGDQPYEAGGILASWWAAPEGSGRLVAVNFAERPDRARVYLPVEVVAQLTGRALRFVDRLGSSDFTVDGDALAERGLVLDLPAWGHPVFDVIPA